MFGITNILATGGLVLLAAVIFAESGMMVGFFFPGDTLLLSAGVLAASGRLSLFEVIVVVALAAILGDNTGYQIGRYLGPKLFRKPDGIIFRKDHILRAQAFYDKYGSRTMLLAHFVPIVRTFAPVTAGAGNMSLKRFIIFDAIGDTTWAILITLFGYFVGSRIPRIDQFIEPVLVAIVVLSFAPTLYHLARDARVRKAFSSLARKRL